MQIRRNMARKWASFGLLTASVWGSSCGRDATEFKRIGLDDRTRFDTTEDARPLERGSADQAALSSGLASRDGKIDKGASDEKPSKGAVGDSGSPSTSPHDDPSAQPTPVDPDIPDNPALPSDPDQPEAPPIEPVNPVDPGQPGKPGDPGDPGDPIVPAPRTVHVSLGQAGSVASYISCAQMTLTGSSGQEHVFDLGCSGNVQSGSQPPETSVEWTEEASCLLVSVSVQTFRTVADHASGGPYWERTLAVGGSASDSDYFQLADAGPGTFLIGYEDLPLPYDQTDKDHDDLILRIAVTGGLEPRFPPLTPACTVPHPEAGLVE